MELPRYFILGEQPVKFIETNDNGMDVVKYDWHTGNFISDLDYLSEIYSADEVEEVTEEEFNKYLEKLRNEKQ